MKILELFSGTECLSDAFRRRGHECFTVDWDKKFPSSLHIDILALTADIIREQFGQPDIIWGGFDCTTFSVAAIGHHRRRNPDNGSLEPKTEGAARTDEVNKHSLNIIRELAPKFFFIENPMGGLRKMEYMQPIPRHMITYCQYGFEYRKATDIWTNHPDPQFLPPCKNGDPCHVKAPRGTKLGLQAIKDKAERSKYPPRLCEHIVDICEQGFDLQPLPVALPVYEVNADMLTTARRKYAEEHSQLLLFDER